MCHLWAFFNGLLIRVSQHREANRRPAVAWNKQCQAQAAAPARKLCFSITLMHATLSVMLKLRLRLLRISSNQCSFFLQKEPICLGVGPKRAKKAPGNAVSQGGLGHDAFPGAIGRSATLTADRTVRSGVPGMSEARRRLPCRGRTLRGPLRSRRRRNPKCGPIHADKSLRRREYGICRPASRPNFRKSANLAQPS
jgi:hypothetical protein